MSLEVRRPYYLSYPLRCAPWNFNCTLQTVSYSSLISIDDWQSSRNFRSVSGRNGEFPFSLSLFLIPQITNTRSVSWYTMLFFPWHLLKIRSDVVGDSLVYRNSLSWHILAYGLACELVDCYHIRHMCLPIVFQIQSTISLSCSSCFSWFKRTPKCIIYSLAYRW